MPGSQEAVSVGSLLNLKRINCSDEEKAFLKAIMLEPKDITTRLVYADWLEEHGRETVARCIREWCRRGWAKVTSTEYVRNWKRLEIVRTGPIALTTWPVVQDEFRRVLKDGKSEPSGIKFWRLTKELVKESGVGYSQATSEQMRGMVAYALNHMSSGSFYFPGDTLPDEEF